MATAGDRAQGLTRTLLDCGVAAGPIYLGAGVAQGLLREGFDFARHPLSVLANGPWGWIQTVNFAVTGLLVIAAALGMRRMLAPRPGASPMLLRAYGIAMLVAAVFPADPVDGFPPGTPEGFPTSISTTGLLHFAAGALAFTFLAFSALAAAWTFWRRGVMSLALPSLFTGLSVLVGFFGGMALPLGIAGIWFAVVIGWVWLAAVCLHLRVRGL